MVSQAAAAAAPDADTDTGGPPLLAGMADGFLLGLLLGAFVTLAFVPCIAAATAAVATSGIAPALKLQYKQPA